MDLCFEFTLGRKRLEAVRCFEVTEELVPGDEAIRRTDNGHIVRSDDDWAFVLRHRTELPKELKKAYWLATARPSPGRLYNVSSLHYRGPAWRIGAGQWYVSWDSLNSPWDRKGLVLRFA